MLSYDIRKKFLEYFRAKAHRILPSSPVIPNDDPTLLFINAGMNQFKDVFLGKSKRDYKRAATTQKCIRVGGKHNDLENVGHTSRHLTFFEMLGNFSFGDYFKKEAIDFAWDVTQNIFEYDVDRIWASVYQSDDEAFELWKKYLPEKRIIRLGEKDNFWSMGETGPCGPCSELLYDRGELFGKGSSPFEDPSGERFVEFWNLVFMEFERDLSGLKPLAQKSIDTGAGLERIVQFKMGAASIFETDILRELIIFIENLCHIPYDPLDKKLAPAFHVIADHVRTLCFAIADGVSPSNVDRGYILRKVLRRALRYGKMLDLQKPFLSQLLSPLINLMGENFPELKAAEHRIQEILTIEEESFLRTLRRGGNLLSQVIESSKKEGIISGEDAFKLKDTYGFPVEEIALLATDVGMAIDLQKYESLENEAKQKSRLSRKTFTQKVSDAIYDRYLEAFGESIFLGYDTLAASVTIHAILQEDQEISQLSEGQKAGIILDKTPFYAEKGGQVGDKGYLILENSFRFCVENTQVPYPGVIIHYGFVEKGHIEKGHTLFASVDVVRRQKIANNHTATHLLHFALRTILGTHVKQAGSLVEPERLRFDFNYHKPLTPEQIISIENLVNSFIRSNIPLCTYELSYEEASQKKEIIQFFGEKYRDVVRVVEFGTSQELCGGTHAKATGDIGYFRILKEGSIAASTRRIEAVTGEEAEKWIHEKDILIEKACNILKTSQDQLLEKIESYLSEKKELEEALKKTKKEMLTAEIENLLEYRQKEGDISWIAHHLPLPSQEMKEIADLLMEREKSLILFLVTQEDKKCSFIAKISQDFISKGFRANDLIAKVAPILNGKGGGKADLAQGAGFQPENIPLACQKVKEWILSLQ